MKLISALLAPLLLLSFTATSQLITVRTYPVLSEDTYMPLPTRYGGMGKVSIALLDDEREPFINPATLLSRQATYASVFILPRVSSWDVRSTSQDLWPSSSGMWATENRQNAANYFAPVGVIQKSGTTALGLLATVHRTTSHQFRQWSSGPGSQATQPEEASFAANNLAVAGSGAALIPGTAIAVGVGATLADVRGIDGVQFLYPDSKSIDINGKLREYRLGMFLSPSGQDQLSLLGGWNSMEIHQRAEYEWSTSPTKNEDKNHTWFGQVNYRVPVSERATIGLLGIGNWREHPKLPDYPISGVPRDPGTTRAFNAGIGASLQTSSNALLAVEYIFEPILTNTWVEALQDLDRGDGVVVVRRGEKQQENTYTFANHIARFGAQIEALEWVILQVGAESRTVQYDFVSRNYQWNTEHRAAPQSRWQEITLTGAVRLSLGSFNVAYGIELLTGRGLLSGTWLRPILWENFRAADVIVPPTDWLSIKPAPVFTHQVSIRYTFEATE